MQMNLSKKDLEQIILLVKDNSEYCKSCGFHGHDKLIAKLTKVLKKSEVRP